MYTTKSIEDARRGELAARDLSDKARKIYSGSDGIAIKQDVDGNITLVLDEQKFDVENIDEASKIIEKAYLLPDDEIRKIVISNYCNREVYKDADEAYKDFLNDYELQASVSIIGWACCVLNDYFESV